MIVRALTTPAGTTNASRLAMKPSRRTGPSDGARARKKAGTPMVSVEATVIWRGRNG